MDKLSTGFGLDLAPGVSSVHDAMEWTPCPINPNPCQVVYMDEPSTGLDPASRKNLWDVVKEAKKESCIILTSECLISCEHPILCETK